jgi:hypothetical protein
MVRKSDSINFLWRENEETAMKKEEAEETAMKKRRRSAILIFYLTVLTLGNGKGG